jgi:hypothetical protein
MRFMSFRFPEFNFFTPAFQGLPTQVDTTMPPYVQKIPLLYRLFFLYLDPFTCLSGIYLSFFDPTTFILNGVPSPLRTPPPSTPLDPLVTHLLRSIGAYSVCIFALQIILLHQFKNAPGGLNVQLWKILQFSILTVDLGLLYGGALAAGGVWKFLNLGKWDTGDWTNNGILGFVALVRSAFLMGVGL